MMKFLAGVRLLAAANDMRRRVEQLSTTIDVLGRAMELVMPKKKPAPVDTSQIKQTRMIVAHNGGAVCIHGTPDEIENAARRAATRTKGCVSVCVVVGKYHRRGGCEEHPAGGYIPEGN